MRACEFTLVGATLVQMLNLSLSSDLTRLRPYLPRKLKENLRSGRFVELTPNSSRKYHSPESIANPLRSSTRSSSVYFLNFDTIPLSYSFCDNALYLDDGKISTLLLIYYSTM